MRPVDEDSRIDPTFAVVIPAYNAADTIERALHSALGQSRPPDEVIVSDDGSSDDTVARVERAGSTAIRVVSSNHGGAAAARNAGDAAASSDYIAYLDADDIWVPSKLERFEAIIRALDRPPFLLSDFRRYVDGAERFKPLSNSDIFGWIRDWPASESTMHGTRIRQIEPRAATEALLKGYPFFPSAAVVRRRAVLTAGGWNPRFTRSQDFEIALRLAFQGGLVYIDEPLTHVHVHADQRDAYRWTARQLEWDLRVMRYHAEGGGFFPDEIRKRIRHFLGRRTVYRGDFSREHGHRREACAWYLRALGRPGGRLRGAARLLSTAAGAGGAAPSRMDSP